MKGTRTYARGSQVLRAGKVTIRLRALRAVRPGVYRLRITVGKTTRTVKVTVRRTVKAGGRVWRAHPRAVDRPAAQRDGRGGVLHARGPSGVRVEELATRT